MSPEIALVAALPWVLDKMLEHTVGGAAHNACAAPARIVWRDVTPLPAPPRNHDIAGAHVLKRRISCALLWVRPSCANF